MKGKKGGKDSKKNVKIQGGVEQATEVGDFTLAGNRETPVV